MPSVRSMTSLLLAAATALAGVSAPAATALSYASFPDAQGLKLTGSAATVGGALRLTPDKFMQSGSAFFSTPISLADNASFSTQFQFRFTRPYGSDGVGPGADGLIFTLAPHTGSTFYGVHGYQGMRNSVGIEFDTYENLGVDNYSSNHVGLNVDGDMASVAIAPVGEADMNNGQVWNAWIDYDGVNHVLEVRVTQSATRPAAPLLSITRDLTQDLKATTAYAGFAAATGGAYAIHEVLSWRLDASVARSVAEPGTLPLLAVALAGAGAIRRRRR